MGGSGFLCPQGWLESSWVEAVGAGSCAFLLCPPMPDLPA